MVSDEPPLLLLLLLLPYRRRSEVGALPYIAAVVVGMRPLLKEPFQDGRRWSPATGAARSRPCRRFVGPRRLLLRLLIHVVVVVVVVVVYLCLRRGSMSGQERELLELEWGQKGRRGGGDCCCCC